MSELSAMSELSERSEPSVLSAISELSERSEPSEMSGLSEINLIVRSFSAQKMPKLCVFRLTMSRKSREFHYICTETQSRNQFILTMRMLFYKL